MRHHPGRGTIAALAVLQQRVARRRADGLSGGGGRQTPRKTSRALFQYSLKYRLTAALYFHIR